MSSSLPSLQPDLLEPPHMGTELHPHPKQSSLTILSENGNETLVLQYHPQEKDLDIFNPRITEIFPNETKIHDSIIPNPLVYILSKLFRDSAYEIFEDGMDSSFSDGLGRIIMNNGRQAIHALGIIMKRDHGGEVVEEALRQIGNMKDERTHYGRRVLLEHKLKSRDSHVRDAALTGIEYMDDPASIPSLRMAIGREDGTLMRKNMKAVLAQLQNA